MPSSAASGRLRRSLLWRLLGINLLVVAIVVALTAVAVRLQAEAIFARLMHDFHVPVDAVAGPFATSVARALIAVSVAASLVGLLLSVVLFRRVVRPLRRMTALAERLAAGDYAARTPVEGADEVGRLAESLNRMAEALERLERLRADLVADVAHELRTPLANLRGYLEALRDGVAPATAETVRLLHDEVMRLVRLVEALRQLSGLDARAAAVRREPVDPAALLTDLLALRQGEVRARGVTVRTEVALDGPLHADPTLLAQALQNLLDNALAYGEPHGEVVCRIAREPDGAVRVAVTNTGDPIPPQDLPFIFERFYRAEKSRSRASGGAGIGLAIVKEVARLHGGTVGAASGDGTTTVWFTLRPPPPAAAPSL